MNPTYCLIDLRRMLRNPATLIFAIAMPVVLYVIFGATQSYTDHRVAHGTVGGVIMASMAYYGAAVAAQNLATTALTEQEAGWGRQLALTPLVGARFVVTKMVAVLAVCLAPVLVVAACGVFTGARIDGIR